MEKLFPIQDDRDYPKPYPRRIPWSIAKLAFDVWAARYGRETMEHFAGRGGFGPGEMDMYLPGWLERVDENILLRNKVDDLEAENRRLSALTIHHDGRVVTQGKGEGCGRPNTPTLYVDNGYVRVKGTDHAYLLVPEDDIRFFVKDNNVANLYISVAKTRDSIIGAMIMREGR